MESIISINLNKSKNTQIIIIPSGGDFSKGNSAAIIHSKEIQKAFENFVDTYLIYESSEQVTTKVKSTRITLKNNKLLLVLSRNLYYPFLFIKLFKKNIIFHKKSIVYSRYGSLTLSALIAAKALNLYFVVEVNGSKTTEIYSKRKPSTIRNLQERIIQLHQKILFKHADNVIAVTSGIKEEILYKHPVNSKKVYVVHNGVRGDIIKEPIVLRGKKKIDLLFVGSLQPWHNAYYLAKYLPEIIQRADSRIHLTIAGMGDEFYRIKELLTKKGYPSERLHLLGKIRHNKVFEIIDQSDICLLPSLARNRHGVVDPDLPYGSPIKLFEYLARGKVVIASNLDGIRSEKAKFNDQLILIEPNNLNDLISAIQKAIKISNNPKSVTSILRKEYTWLNIAKKILSFVD